MNCLGLFLKIHVNPGTRHSHPLIWGNYDQMPMCDEEKVWPTIQKSTVAKHTTNPIRNIVDRLRIAPNPAKSSISLGLGTRINGGIIKLKRRPDDIWEPQHSERRCGGNQRGTRVSSIQRISTCNWYNTLDFVYL